jgi:hypothetical protein
VSTVTELQHDNVAVIAIENAHSSSIACIDNRARHQSCSRFPCPTARRQTRHCPPIFHTFPQYFNCIATRLAHDLGRAEAGREIDEHYLGRIAFDELAAHGTTKRRDSSRVQLAARVRTASSSPSTPTKIHHAQRLQVPLPRTSDQLVDVLVEVGSPSDSISRRGGRLLRCGISIRPMTGLGHSRRSRPRPHVHPCPQHPQYQP